MNWINILLGLILAGEFVAFAYLVYLAWKETKFTLRDAQRLKDPIESFVQEGRSLQPLVESLSMKANYLSAEVREVIDIGKDTSYQVRTLTAAVGAYRNPNVQLAIRYGRDWIEERRANPFVRSLKRATRKIRNKFRKLQERLKGE
ncbi:MAG TPA: hypothetical protein VLH08_14955 [Acidobacteriota bacterium]|nr:hypothetical protein [Acidobacteriota bacterium]